MSTRRPKFQQNVLKSLWKDPCHNVFEFTNINGTKA